MQNGSPRAAVFLCIFAARRSGLMTTNPINYGRNFALRQGKNHLFLLCLTKKIR
jgi:hypothetical protein